MKRTANMDKTKIIITNLLLYFGRITSKRITPRDEENDAVLLMINATYMFRLVYAMIELPTLHESTGHPSSCTVVVDHVPPGGFTATWKLMVAITVATTIKLPRVLSSKSPLRENQSSTINACASEVRVYVVVPPVSMVINVSMHAVMRSLRVCMYMYMYI